MKSVLVRCAVSAFAFLLVSTAGASASETPTKLDPVTLDGLLEPVRVRRDAHDVPHIFALDERDAAMVLGYLHAQDRFFQMDVLRRTFGGTLAELLGPPGVAQDVQFRTFGMRRVAEASLPLLSEETRDQLEAYADGVNGYLDRASELPVEYAALELTLAGVPRWTAIDTLAIANGISFGFSFDISDLDYTAALLQFQAAGASAGFDGTALFFEDVYRVAPFDPATTIPDSERPTAMATRPDAGKAKAPKASYLGARTLALVASFRSRIAEIPRLRNALAGRDRQQGSNWWLIAGEHTASGHALMASDPHLALDVPAQFYEAQIRIRKNGDPPRNTTGMGFVGTPGIALGCNPWICWGSTFNPMDVTDVYQEELFIDPALGLPTHTRFEDQLEPLVVIPQQYLVNQIDDGVPDNLVDAGVGPLEGGFTVLVPRRNNGPIIALDLSDPMQPLALSVQYAGSSPNRNAEAFARIAQARSLADFTTALQSFDLGSQNMAYADIAGNIAYFTSAEMPIREDLQLLGFPDGGVPPFMVRDGTHALRHEWLPVQSPQPGQALPYEILPFAEMPQVVNPEQGFLISANNAPISTTLDNDPFNTLRPGGGLLYLNPGYAPGLRAGRIQRLVEGAIAGGEPLDLDDMASFQANNQLLDAQVLVPYIVTAFDNTYPAGATAPDPTLAEAVQRLAAWDFSTPTGIAAGFDPGDDPDNLKPPSPAEIEASVAATIYSVWRGQIVRRVIDGTLAEYGLESYAPGSLLAMPALRNLLDRFDEQQGYGASSLDFFADPGGPTRAAARDAALLGALTDALDLLASDAFAPAFAGSTDLGDYRWGYLHRVVFDHPLGGTFDVPPAGGFGSVTPELPGIARAGGFGSVDAAEHSVRADGLNEFMFGSGPARRFVGELRPSGVDGHDVLPGGQSGRRGDPFQTDQLGLWLTNRYRPVLLFPEDVVAGSRTFQKFVPSAP